MSSNVNAVANAESGDLASLLVILLLTAHLWAMNVASAGPLLGIWLGRHRTSPLQDSIGKSLAWLAVGGLVLGMATGGLQLYCFTNAGLFAAMNRLPTRALWFAGAELLFSLICLLIYAGCWDVLRNHRWWHAFVALATSSNLLYHFPPLMSVLGKLAYDPTWAKAEVLNRAELLPLMLRSEVLALSAHFALASIAVSAITVLWLLSRVNGEEAEKSKQPLSRCTAWIALISTSLQLPVGIWLLIALPRAMRTSMMGTSVAASMAFIGALLLTFLLIQKLLTIAIGTTQPRELRQACWTLAALVLLMTTTLYVSRSAGNRSVLEKKTAVVPSTSKVPGTTAAGSY